MKDAGEEVEAGREHLPIPVQDSGLIPEKGEEGGKRHDVRLLTLQPGSEKV